MHLRPKLGRSDFFMITVELVVYRACTDKQFCAGPCYLDGGKGSFVIERFALSFLVFGGNPLRSYP